jgi:hypothetical protein
MTDDDARYVVQALGETVAEMRPAVEAV